LGIAHTQKIFVLSRSGARLREQRRNSLFLRLIGAACRWVPNPLWSDRRKHAM